MVEIVVEPPTKDFGMKHSNHMVEAKWLKMVEISVVQPQRIKREKLKLMTHHSHIRITKSPYHKLHCILIFTVPILIIY